MCCLIAEPPAFLRAKSMAQGRERASASRSPSCTSAQNRARVAAIRRSSRPLCNHRLSRASASRKRFTCRLTGARTDTHTSIRWCCPCSAQSTSYAKFIKQLTGTRGDRHGSRGLRSFVHRHRHRRDGSCPGGTSDPQRYALSPHPPDVSPCCADASDAMRSRQRGSRPKRSSSTPRPRRVNPPDPGIAARSRLGIAWRSEFHEEKPSHAGAGLARIRPTLENHE